MWPSAAWIDFPKLSAAKEKVMSSAASRLYQEFGPNLNPSLTPPEVRSFQSKDGVSQGSLVLRAGKQDSQIRYLLGSWIHSTLPFGALSITTVQAAVKPENDSPHLVVEMIQSGEKSLVLYMDNIPRKDLFMNPEYLKRFYEDTKLDELRAKLIKIPQCEYYVPPSLFVRVNASPTALLLQFTAEDEKKMDELVEEFISPCVEEGVSIWLRGFKELGESPTSEAEANVIRTRDELFRKNSVEVDIARNMPRLLGQEITDAVIAAVMRGE